MAEELMIVLKRSENSGFGFSLLGTTGPPHVIYDIVENSPAADCGEVEAGDIIVKVNGTDVHRYTTKEVLKCLRLSQDLVTLELKRDPKIKAHIKEHLARTSNLHNSDVIPSELYELSSQKSLSPNEQQYISDNNSLSERSNSSSCGSNGGGGSHHRVCTSDPICRPSRIPTAVRSPTPKSVPQSPNSKKLKSSHIPTVSSSSYGNNNITQNNNNGQQSSQPTIVPQPPIGKARFEAYMMTGDLILNLSRTPQSSNLITSHAKKIDSLRDSPKHTTTHSNGALVAPRASGESTPSSSPTYSESSDSINSIKKKDKIRRDHIINSSCSSNNKDRHLENELLKDTTIYDNSNKTDTFIDKQVQQQDKQQKHKIHQLQQQQQQQHNTAEQNQLQQKQENESRNPNEQCYRGGGDDVEERLVIAYNDDLSAFVSSSSSSICNRKEDDLCTFDSVEYNSRKEQFYNKTDFIKSQISSSSSSTVKSGEIRSSSETSFSVPTSPISLSTPLIDVKDTSNSVPTSPEQSIPDVIRRQHNGVVRKCDSAGFRTSKSEDHLQQAQRDGLGAVIPIDIDEDVNSSLNTLLDTRQDSEDSQSSNRDRIVWTYNAPIPHHQNTTTSPNSHSSSISSSPQRSDSPASPTSVSSSVMSSNSGSKGAMGGITLSNNTGGGGMLLCPVNGDQSVSEAISNISSPDYQDDDNLLSSKDLAGMALSDPSDSDSTILVSEAAQRKRDMMHDREHKIIIQVKGNDLYSNYYSELKDSEDELVTLTEDAPTVVVGGQDGKESSPPVSDDGSDVDSLHSYHYSPKAVDMPSAVRLAKRLYSLDGFKKSDVSRHLSKNNDFSRAVADEYLKYFKFDKQTLDESLREFLQQFSLSGETQERERVLVHFSKRYLDCNPGTFNSQDAVHTLTCAIMLLNTDLHGQNIGRKMTCAEFVDNLAELNDGENFPKDVLKFLYQAIKNHPLEWALDDESPEQQKQRNENNVTSQIGSNPFLDTPQSSAAIEYKKGYVMRKCCYDTNYKKNCCGFILAPFGKRSWKMFYCTLRDLVLYLHKDEHGFRKNQMSDNVHNAIRIHHALATKAADYTKKQHVFRLQTADQSEFLFQTSDSKELQSWIDTINYVCASFSAPPLEGGVGSQKRFQRPLLPSSHTKLLLREQLNSHEQQVIQLESALNEHKRGPVPSKGLPLQNYKEKEAYLQYELKRYQTYVSILNTRILAEQQMDMQNCLMNVEESYPPGQGGGGGGTQPHRTVTGNIVVPTSQNPTNNILQQAAGVQQQQIIQQQQQQQTTNRYSYRAAIYRTDAQQDIG